jgi:hypothetical protein
MTDPKPKSDPFFESALDGFKGSANEEKGTSISEKMEVLRRFPLLFRDIDVALTNIVPILMHRKEVHLFMERIYDRQVELLLKRKSVETLDLPRVVRDMISEQNNITRQHFLQSISNLVYSAERFSPKFPELGLFLSFCRAGSDSYHLLFYLFLRQHFKILTYTSFLAHKKSAGDPTAIQLTRESGSEILRTALSHDPIAHGMLREEFNALYKEKSKATYYEFMLRLTQVKMNFKDLVLLDKLIALYAVDYQEQLKKHFESKSPNHNRGKKNGDGKDLVGRDSIDQAVFGSGNHTPENIVRAAPTPPEEDGLLDIQEGEPKQPSSNVRPKQQEASRRPRLVLARKSLENFYLAVKAQIPIVIQGLLMSFPISKSFDYNKVQENSNVIGVLIENKLSAIVDAVFAENPRKFARLLRDEHNLNGETAKAWEGLLEILHQEEIDVAFTDKDAVELLTRLNGIPVIHAHINFLVGYRFKSEKELSDLQAKERELLEQV